MADKKAIKRLPFAVLEQVKQEIIEAYKEPLEQLTDRLSAFLSEVPHPDEQVLMNLEKGLDVDLPPRRELSEGDAVLLKSVTGTWEKAVISEISDRKVLVRKSDGSTRAANRAMLVASSESHTGQVIRLEKFGVTIFEGTKSWEVEKKLEPITARMNKHILRVNAETWKRNLAAQAVITEERLLVCKSLVNGGFNPGSPQQVVAALEARGHHLGRKTASGGTSAGEAVLTELSNEGDELAKAVMEYRSERSTLSQLEKWKVHAEDGYVQTIWDQYGQPHGRYTSDSPSLHNRVVPIRETIEAAPGKVFVSVDWGAAEYVTWASLSKDPMLKSIFESGRDVHFEMGRDITTLLKKSLGSAKEERDYGKTINFAVLYRMLSWTLAKSLGVPAADADQLIRLYKTRAKVAAQYIEDVLDKAARDGYVETYLGRRRDCPELATLRGPALHQVQKTMWHHHNAGTAAELLKLKQININNALNAVGLCSDIALQMHDEIIYEVPEAQAPAVASVAEESMRKTVGSFLPFSVTTKIGKNWKATSK